MYCHLCRVDATATHDSSSEHRAARELAAIAVDRLSDHLSASIGDDPNGLENMVDSLNITVPDEATDKKSTTVTYCDPCNVSIPVTELLKHQRLRTHTLALLNDQIFEELAGHYVDKEHRRLMEDPRGDAAEGVDETQAVKTYKCHLCVLQIPVTFKNFHERSSRHLAGRALAASAAKRASRALARSEHKSKHTSEDNKHQSEDISKQSEDTSKDQSEDTSKDSKIVDKRKFTGKMMKKLLKLYSGRTDDVYVEENEADTEEKIPQRRLTAQEYFTQILPMLSYLQSYQSIAIDDTEYVTIKIGRDLLRIHINNYSGLASFERNGVFYLKCKICDGFNSNNCSVLYSPEGEEDKAHVMSLGHVQKLVTPFEDFHLIRKFNEAYAICALCNVCIYIQHIELHTQGAEHTTALFQALERGKEYKETKKNLNFMMFKTKCTHKVNSNNIFNNRNANWHRFPNQPLFGSQNNAATFGSQNNGTTFGLQNNAATFGSQNYTTGFGSAQNTAFGSGERKTGTFRSVQSNGASFGSGQNNTASFGSAQNKGATFGVGWNNTVSFGSAQSTGAAFGSGQNKGTPFSIGQNNAATVGYAQNNATTFGSGQNNPAPFGSAQNKGAAFGSSQNNADSFGSAQNNPASFGSGSNNGAIGKNQNNDTSFGFFAAENKRPALNLDCQLSQQIKTAAESNKTNISFNTPPQAPKFKFGIAPQPDISNASLQHKAVEQPESQSKNNSASQQNVYNCQFLLPKNDNAGPTKTTDLPVKSGTTQSNNMQDKKPDLKRNQRNIFSNYSSSSSDSE